MVTNTRTLGMGRSMLVRVVALVTTLSALGGMLACSPVVRVRPFRNDKIAYWTAEGGVVVSSYDRTNGTTRLCVAPPAQGARQKDLTGAIGGRVPKIDVDLQASGGIEHHTQSLYDQSDAGLFFQFALYRLCEAYLNGAVSDEQYVRVYSCLVKDAARLVEVEKQYAVAAETQAKYSGMLVVKEDDKPSDDKTPNSNPSNAETSGGGSSDGKEPGAPPEKDCWSTITGT